MITFKQFIAEDSKGRHGEYVGDVAEKTMIHAILNQLFGGQKTDELYDLAYSFIEAPTSEAFYERYYDAFAEKAKQAEAKHKGEQPITLSPQAGIRLGEFRKELPTAFKAWKSRRNDA